jgi:FKBP-type peptidyl-prolyl cis-trans isomerase
VIVRRAVVGLALPVLLVAAACSGSGGSTTAKVGTLASVKVSGSATAKPVVDFKAPLKFRKTDSRVVDPGPGTGPAVKLSSLVTVRYIGINASDQGVFGSNWSVGPSTFYVNSVVKGFAEGLVGAHAGDRVLICSPAKDAFGATGNVESSVRPGDSVIFVVDVKSVARVESTPATVPKLTYDASGNPAKFTAGAQTARTPTTLGVYPLISGPGPKVRIGDTVSVEYFGQIYPDGSVFNAWSGQPFTFKLGAAQVIPGWEEGLVGQRVGSRLVLVVPPDLGYGKKAQSGIPANSTLIFAIEILSVNSS